MKAKAKAKLDSDWWKKEQPKGLKKSAPKFAAALTQYEKWDSALDKDAEKAIPLCHDALDHILKTAKEVVKEVDAKLKEKGLKPAERTDLENTKLVMVKPLEAVVVEATKELVKLDDEARKADSKDDKKDTGKASASKDDAKDEKQDEDDAGDSLKNAAAHKDYVVKMLKKLKSKTFNFAVGLPTTKPEDMRISFHPTKGGRALASTLRSEIKAKKVAFGRAGMKGLAEEVGLTSQSKTLDLMIDGTAPSGLAKRLRMMFRDLGISKSTKIRLLSEDGQMLEADEEDSTKDVDEIKDRIAKATAYVNKNLDASRTRMLTELSEPLNLAMQKKPREALAELNTVLARIADAEAQEKKDQTKDAVDGRQDGEAIKKRIAQATKYIKDNLGDYANPFLRKLAEPIELAGRKKFADADLALNKILKEIAEHQKKEGAEPKTDDIQPDAKAKKKAALISALNKLSDSALSLGLPKEGWDEIKKMRGRLERASKKLEADFDAAKALIQKLSKTLKDNRPVEQVKRLDALMNRLTKLSPSDDNDTLTKLGGQARKMISTRDAKREGPNADDVMDRIDEKITELEADEAAMKLKQQGLGGALPLQNDHVLGAIKDVPFFKQQLMTTDDSGGEVEKRNRQGQTLTENIKQQLDVFQKNFTASNSAVTENAMKMLVALKAVSREVAGDNNLSRQPTFTKKTLQYYREDLIKAMAKDDAGPPEGDLAASMKLLDALASDDPLRPYMEMEVVTGVRNLDFERSQKVAPEKVVERVRDMAEKGGVEPSEMMKILSQMHQMELGAFTKDEVKKGELKNYDEDGKLVTNFNVSRLTGETPPELFDAVVGDFDDKGRPAFGPGGMKYSKEAKQKLDSLRQAVGAWDTGATTRPLPDGTGPDAKNKKTPKEDYSDKEVAAKIKAEQDAKRAKLIKVVNRASRKAQARGETIIDRRLETPKGADYVPPVGLKDEGLNPEEQEQFSGPLTEKQYRFLRAGIREELDSTVDEDPQKAEELVVDVFVEIYGFPKKQAKTMFAKCREFLNQAPMTITVNADDMFNNDGNPAYSKDYSPAQIRAKKVEDDAERFGDGAEESEQKTRSMAPGPTDRGKEYGRWREEKDERETGGNSFLPDENAVFGAVNVNYPRTDGGDGGIYGKEHLVMKDSVKSVSTFCFTTAGKERRDMSMILLDMARHPKGKTFYLPLLMNNAMNADKTVDIHNQLDLEFHCYGPIDLTKDVDQISVPSPDTSKDPEEKRRLEFLHKKVTKFSENRMKPPVQWESLDAKDVHRPAEAMEDVRAAAVGIDKKTDPELFECQKLLNAFNDALPSFDGNLPNFKNKRDSYIAAADAFLKKYDSDSSASMKKKCKKVKKDRDDAKALFIRVQNELTHKDKRLQDFFGHCYAIETLTTSPNALTRVSEFPALIKAIRKVDKTKRPDTAEIKARAKAAVGRAIKLCELDGVEAPDSVTKLHAAL